MTRPWLTLVLLACWCCLPSRAFCLVALPAPGGAVDEQELRLIMTAHGQRSSLSVEWVLRVTGDHFWVLAPLESGGTLDLADPAWFAAVEHATAPRILPPSDIELGVCDAIDGVHDTTDLARGERALPRAVTTLTAPAELAAFLDTEALHQGNAISFADFGEPEALVALEYPAISGAPILVQLRFEATNAPDVWLERLRPSGSRAPLPVTLTVLAHEPVLLDVARVTSDDVPTNWRGTQSDSDYPVQRSRFLDENPGAWVTEVVGATHLFDAYYPDGQAAVPSVVAGFHERVVGRGYACPDFEEWLEAARDRDALAPVACGRGELASLDPPACPSGPGPANELECEGIDDLALALSGARLSKLVLTRQVGRLPTSAALVPEPAAASHTAKAYADALIESACGEGGASGTSSDGSGGTGGAGSAGGSGGSSASFGGAAEGNGGFWTNSTSASSAGGGSSRGRSSSSGGGSGYPDYYHEDEVTVRVQTESFQCGSSSSSSESSCSGDSSPEDDGGDETCSGDSSEGSGDSCSGDSGGDVEGDTCSGANEGGDATCAGDSGGDCAVGRRGFPRPRLSVVTLLLAAGALPWRRRHRRKH